MQYVGARYVPKFMGLYDATQAYEALCVVDNGMGTSYITRVPTPAGTPLTDTDYYAVYGASSGAIINLQNQIGDLSNLTTTDQDSLVDAINEIQTLTNNKIKTPEEFGAVGDGMTDDTAALQAAFDNADVILLRNNYKITDTLFVYGKKSIIGNGTITAYLPETTPPTDVYLMILGASNFGDTEETFSGKIDGINFVLMTGRYNYVIGGVNADNCEITNCNFDLSRVDCHNKVIFFGPNGTIALNNGSDSHYKVDNNSFVFDSNPSGTTNQCEPVGFQSKDNIVVTNNISEKGKDDFGFHNCSNITCIGNKLVDNYKTRFLFTNSKNIVCNDNVINQNINIWSQGIVVGWESGFTDGHFPENFEICGNVIDFRGNLHNGYTYGIWADGARNGIIANNRLLADTLYHGRIFLQNVAAFEDLLTTAYAENIDIHDNICNAIGHALGAGLASDVISPVKVHDNIIKFTLSLNSWFDVSEHNTLVDATATMTIAKNYQSTRYNTSCVIDGTAMDGTEQPMLIDGLPELIVEKRARLLSAYFASSSPEVSLSGGNYITYEVKKNGTTIATIDSQHNTYGTLTATDFDAKDVLTVTARYYGTAPSPKPSYVGLKFNLEYFEDC